MLTEISLNVLDIAENSIKAGALNIKITVKADTKKDLLVVCIDDDGCGMSQENVKQSENPFYTSRTTRKVGLGIPFFKQSCEMTGGNFRISSKAGKGTCVRAEFIISSIDRMPLGDISETIYSLISINVETDFIYTYTINDKSFTLNTKEIKKIMKDIPINTPEVLIYIKEFLEENKREVDSGITL